MALVARYYIAQHSMALAAGRPTLQIRNLPSPGVHAADLDQSDLNSARTRLSSRRSASGRTLGPT